MIKMNLMVRYFLFFLFSYKLILEETTTIHDRSLNKSARSAGRRPSGTTNRTRQASSAVSTMGRNKSSTILTATSRRKREQQNENLHIAITELLNHFSHRNLDAIVRVIKMTLEKLRKRITSALSYGNYLFSKIPYKIFFPL